MSDCRFGLSPVNYPDPDPDPEEVLLRMSPIFRSSRRTADNTLQTFVFESGLHG